MKNLWLKICCAVVMLVLGHITYVATLATIRWFKNRKRIMSEIKTKL